MSADINATDVTRVTTQVVTDRGGYREFIVDGPTKALTASSDSSVGAGVPPDHDGELNKNTDAIVEDENQDEDGIEAKFLPGETVYVRSMRILARVRGVSNENGVNVYSIDLLGANKEPVGMAVIAESDMELRRTHAAKVAESKAVEDSDMPAFALQTARQALLMAARLSRAVRDHHYDEESDSRAGVLQDVLVAWTRQKLPERQHNLIKTAQEYLNNGRHDWGEADIIGMKQKFTSLVETLHELVKTFSAADVKAEVVSDPDVKVNGSTMPIQTGAAVLPNDMQPSMNAVVITLDRVKKNLNGGKPDSAMCIASLALADNMLASLAVATQDNFPAQRSIEMMRALIGRVAGNLDEPGRRPDQRYPFGSDDARNSLYNQIGQAAFLGHMLITRYAVRSASRIAAAHRVDDDAIKMWEDLNG